MITKKYYKLIRVSHADSGYFYIKNVSNEVGEFKINIVTGNTEYSLDGVTWTSYDFTNRPTVNVNPNSSIYLRGTSWNVNNNSWNPHFTFDKEYIIGGNMLSLVNYTTMTTATTIPQENGGFGLLFYNETNLTGANNVNFGNAYSVGSSAFIGTFVGCSLSTPPDFSSITSVGNNGFYQTFHSNSLLSETPDFSNVTSVGNGGIQQTFTSCSSLSVGPDFSNVTSVGTSGFNGCFNGCTHISNVTAPNIQDLTTGVLSNWLQNAGTQATVTKVVNVPTGATITTGSASGIPTGWTRVDY